MDDLMNFLLENDIADISEEVIISKRVPMKFGIRPMTKNQHADFIKRCRLRNGEFDDAKFQTIVCLDCTEKPNFRDAQAIAKAGVITGEELLTKTLLPGEISALHAKICALSGFDTDINEDVEMAKN
ncbi:MAG: hypothetical protein LBL35_03400 [Clostridiales bacterium]|jgi:hypothetical protein|nr:hypothetical protein [Clostridiales bacterium]